MEPHCNNIIFKNYTFEHGKAENFGAYIYIDDNFDQVRLKLRQVYQPSFLFPYQYKEKLQNFHRQSSMHASCSLA